MVQKLTLRISSRVLYVLSVCFALVSISLLVSKAANVALFYLSSLAPKFFTARSRVVKQIFFSQSGQYGRRVNKVHSIAFTLSHLLVTAMFFFLITDINLTFCCTW